MGLELDERQRAMLQEMGVRVWLPVAQIANSPRADSQWEARSVTPVASPGPKPDPFADEAVVHASSGWSDLAQAAASCQACGLCAGRKQSTLHPPAHQGPIHWMIVGDPPNEDEDRMGMPFVEQAGVLLDNMLKSVRVSRQAAGAAGAYLTNVVKCRPPVGRLPQPGDLVACSRYLHREIALVQPRVIVAMGRFAVQALLAEHPEQAALPLGKLRGMVYRYGGAPVIVTYHPQMLLRASAEKAKAWADLCLGVHAVRGADASLQSNHDLS